MTTDTPTTTTHNATADMMHRIDALLQKHDRPPQRTERDRLRTLAFAVARKWISYPHGRTPASCRDDGLALADAITAGDRHAIARLGVRGQS